MTQQSLTAASDADLRGFKARLHAIAAADAPARPADDPAGEWRRGLSGRS